nr:PEP/pyruvate-binding domain-containing protein [Ornithinimicrobium sp. HY1793]
MGDLAATDPAIVGGKAASLAQLVRSGVDVPAGFVIPTGVFRRHQGSTLDDDLLAQLEVGLRRIGGVSAPVAVRSSATTEDGAAASAAGQHDSVLAVVGTEAASRAVLRCWASLWSDRALAYRAGRGSSGGGTPSAGPGTGTGPGTSSGPASRAGPPEMAVLVQTFVDADVSGVLFTGDATVIEATPGLGDQLVNGQVTPDSWTVDDQGISDRVMGTTSHRSDRVGDRLRRRPLSDDERGQLCLTDAQVLALCRLGQQVSLLLGGPADLEWAITGEQIHVLQARPITTALPPGHLARAHPAGELHGIAASPGTATGPVRVIAGVADFRRVSPGDVLVCEHTDPAWTPLFGFAGAVVTEHGGLLSHAAIVAREIGLPAVVAVPDATQVLRDGTTVRVDGDRGSVTRLEA